MILIVNKDSQDYIPKIGDVYIGRSSALGNPWSHIPNSRAEFAAKSRAEAIQKYSSWIKDQEGEVSDLLFKISGLNRRGVCRLVCHCLPLPCHGKAVREESWRRFGMRVGVIGSRSFRDKDFIFKTLDEAYDKFPYFSEIVSGGASGPDTFGEKWAESRGIPKKIFVPDWLNLGKAAGFIRNRQIVENCDCIFAFWKDESRGTAHSIGLAKQLGIPVKIFKS